MTIQKATLEDLQYLADVERSAARKFSEQLGLPPSDYTRTLPEAVLNKSMQEGGLWIAQDQKEPIAFLASLKYESARHIEELSVSFPYQGQGWAKRLLENFISDSRSNGLKNISLTTDKNIPWSYPLYSKFEFEEVSIENCLEEYLKNILIRDKNHSRPTENRVAMILYL